MSESDRYRRLRRERHATQKAREKAIREAAEREARRAAKRLQAASEAPQQDNL
jgi:hypothetical protein